MNRRMMTYCTMALLSLTLWYLLHHTFPSARIAMLEDKLVEANQRAEEAVLIRSVSKQMEEIAYQQKELSDHQRQRAEQQAQENYRMKLRVEEEWKHAVSSQQEAEKAYMVAESQRKLAEKRQRQAEKAKRKADTLTYLTLGRSLSSIAMTQYRTGNNSTASLLAYAAWLFVKRYGGDTYQSSVFNALTLISRQPDSWQRHQAGISAIVCDQWSRHCLYTCGRYGEVVKWKETSDGYDTEILYCNLEDDFRSVCLDTNHILKALTYTGKVVTFRHPLETSDIGKKKCAAILPSPSGYWLLTQDGQLYNLEGNDLSASYMANSMGRSVAITSVTTDTAEGMMAWGYEDGNILITDFQGNLLKKLTGHSAGVTGLALQDGRLYSCSLDRTLRLWNLREERTEPVTALQVNAWLLCLALSPDRKQVFTGDNDGHLYRLSISPDDMAETIRKHLSRNFTPQEWRHYMGNGIPYETFTNQRY